MINFALPGKTCQFKITFLLQMQQMSLTMAFCSLYDSIEEKTRKHGHYENNIEKNIKFWCLY